MCRIDSALHGCWDVETGGRPIRQDEFPGEEGRRNAGQWDYEDILRYVWSANDDGWANFHAG